MSGKREEQGVPARREHGLGGELRGVGQVFTHVGMKAHMWRMRADANKKK